MTLPYTVQTGPTQRSEDGTLSSSEEKRTLRPRKRVRQEAPAVEAPKPPAKKPKLQKPSPARPRTCSTRRPTRSDENTGKLSLLMDMPLDILFVICSFLPPTTLFGLLDVSNAFRELLTTPNAATIWIGLRKRYSAPEPALCINGSGEFAWARILFDESGKECGECGNRNKTVKHLDFMQCKRICNGCMMRGSVTKATFKRTFRGQEDSVLELVLPFLGRDNKEYYSNAEIAKVISGLSACEDEASIERFKSERLKEMEVVQTRQQAFYAWRQKLEQERVEEENYLCQQRLRDIKKRILDLGYAEEDLVDVEKDKSLNIPIQLTDASWEAIKIGVLISVHHRRKNRLMQCWTGVWGIRRQFIKDLYTEFKGTFTPIDWREFPNTETISLFRGINDLLIVPRRTLTFDDFAPLFRDDWRTFLKKVREWSVCRKERFIIQWRRHFKDDTMNNLARDIGLLRSDEERYTWKMPWQLPSVDFGNLAVAQLECLLCNGVCTTLNAAGRHQVAIGECRSTWPQCRSSMRAERDIWFFEFSPSKTALQVISLSGLNPTTASADDMDAKEDFFKCLACDEGFTGTWRECITYHDIHRIPDFHLVKDHEDERKSWACSLCNAHLVAQETKAAVIGHLKIEHGTTEPKVPKDYFYAGAY